MLHHPDINKDSGKHPLQLYLVQRQNKIKEEENKLVGRENVLEKRLVLNKFKVNFRLEVLLNGHE